MSLLLQDERSISDSDLLERELLVEEFSKLPQSFFSKIRHFQPQIGCLNACTFCSQCSKTEIEYWNTARLRNIVAAILEVVKTKYGRKDEPYIVWDRKYHRNGVVYAYLDNDIGNYDYLDTFISLLHRELGVRTRISTIGYSRHNSKLNKMHKDINRKHLESLAGVRLSFTPYAIGWNDNKRCSRQEYIKDVANILKIYRKYYEFAGAGSRQMCVELRYKPLVELCDVNEMMLDGHKVIWFNGYLYVTIDKLKDITISHIQNPNLHSIVLSALPTMVYAFDIEFRKYEASEIEDLVRKYLSQDTTNYKVSELYFMENCDGIYYAIDPSLKLNGNYGINIFPKNDKRENSGYLVTERFFLNAIAKLKNSINLKLEDDMPNVSWQTVSKVIANLKLQAQEYAQKGNIIKQRYIVEEVLPIITSYIKALKMAGYEPALFFNKRFSIDTGIICNLGRGLSEFKGLTNKANEPLTPIHERNYGKINSLMVQESEAWRISCGYKDSILIEKLIMANTPDPEGQVCWKTSFDLKDNSNEHYYSKDLEKVFLIPGQRSKAKR